MARAKRMLFCGFDTHRADVSVSIAWFRFQADKDAKCIHFIALFSPGLALSESRLWRAI
jgi:hypothetical protein